MVIIEHNPYNPHNLHYTLKYLENLAGHRIILASSSPRRRELMNMLDIPFDVAAPIDVEETYPADLTPYDVPLYLSELKAKVYASTIKPDEVMITADTVVIIDNDVIGKPRDEAEACVMLSRLSGRIHEVVTGITVSSTHSFESTVALTRVKFGVLSPTDIKHYVERFKPLDKAGAYGIQEWIGAIGIEWIDGSFYNVMGLPLRKLWWLLTRFKP